MSTAWVPPRPTYHLRVFVICLVIVLLCLVGFLFGVQMEAIVPATGIVQARDQQDVRAPLAGLIELGWCEGKLTDAASGSPAARLDREGNGSTDPAHGKGLPIRAFKVTDGRQVPKESLRPHALQAGDVLWPGQVFARVRADDLELRVRRMQGRLADEEKRGGATQETKEELATLEGLLARTTLAAPEGSDSWLVLKVHVDAGASVKAGDPVVLLAPLDAVSHKPRDLVVQLQIPEKHGGELQLGQDVRVYPHMYNQRLHGHADARIDRLEPLGEPSANGERFLTAVATITQTPFTLKLGSGCKTEIIVGRKRVYRLILEQ